MEKKLSDLKKNEIAIIKKVEGDSHLKRRLFELGMLVGERVQILSISPLKNSFIISLKGYCFAVRRDVAKKILVV